MVDASDLAAGLPEQISWTTDDLPTPESPRTSTLTRSTLIVLITYATYQLPYLIDSSTSVYENWIMNEIASFCKATDAYCFDFNFWLGFSFASKPIKEVAQKVLYKKTIRFPVHKIAGVSITIIILLLFSFSGATFPLIPKALLLIHVNRHSMKSIL